MVGWKVNKLEINKINIKLIKIEFNLKNTQNRIIWNELKLNN